MPAVSYIEENSSEIIFTNQEKSPNSKEYNNIMYNDSNIKSQQVNYI